MTKIEIRSFELMAEGVENTVCTIPAGLCSAMIREGNRENPFVGDNIREQRTEDVCCDFVARVDIDDVTRSSRYVYLSLSGISANAEVFFNGKSYGFTSSVARSYYFDITDGLREGENELRVHCISPIPKYTEAKDGGSPEYEIDPMLTDIGIFGECYIVATHTAIIENLAVIQRHEADGVTLDISLSCLGDLSSLSAVATLVSQTGKIYYGGIAGGSGSVHVSDPDLWYPLGVGNQPLYRLAVTLYEGSSATDTKEIMIGLRSLSLVEENGAPRLFVNGVPIFSLGTTYITRSGFFPDGESMEEYERKIEKMLRLAREANMNTLRLVGYGYRPPNIFYELCDKYGIVVWQDLSLPYTGSLTADKITRYREAVRDLVGDIAYHASVSVLFFAPCRESGSEAISEGALEEFYSGSNRFIAPIIDRYAGDLVFVPDFEYVRKNDELTVYNGDRGEYPSLPGYDSIRRFTRRKDRNAHSPTVELHAGRGAIPKMLLGISERVRYAGSFDTLVYSSQLSAALAAEQSVGQARIDGNVTGALLRRFNDEWPEVSPAFVDYYGAPKAIYYRAKRFFSPVLVVPRAIGESMLLSVANDCAAEITGALTYALYDDNDKCMIEKKIDVRIPAHSARDIVSEDFSQYISGEAHRYYLLYELTESAFGNHSGVAHFTPIKKFEFKNPYLGYAVSGDGCDFEITVRAEALAVGVCVLSGGEGDWLSDNFVDIPEGGVLRILLKTAEPTDVATVEQRIRLISAYDIDKH